MAKNNNQAIYVVKDDNHKKLKFLAFKLDRSMSDIVREALLDLFKKPEYAELLAQMDEPGEKKA